MTVSALTRLKAASFTAFRELSLEFSPGINIFIGPNGTGKTHILKLLYASLSAFKENVRISDKLIRVFLPYERRLGRLVRRQKGSAKARIQVYRGTRRLSLTFSNHTTDTLRISGKDAWGKGIGNSVYVPVKEMLANAPGFRSLYANREIHFEEVYADLVDKACIPILRGPIDRSRDKLLKTIEKAIEGKVVLEQEHFFLRNKSGKLEFTLLAEGMRKLALIWLLIQNGVLSSGATLFWDEPEANLNPGMIRTITQLLLEIQRRGVQVFLATHHYVLLKEFDLQKSKKDDVRFHSLYPDPETSEIMTRSSTDLVGLDPNAITEAYVDLYNREVERTFGRRE